MSREREIANMNKGKKRIVAITYANEKYIRAAKLNIKSARKIGRVNDAFLYEPKDIDASFKKSHEDIFRYEKGNGYWLWKPYVILKTLEHMSDNDILIYTDSTIIYREEAQKLINAMEGNHADRMIFLLGKEYTEAKYTKRDAFILMDSDDEKYYNTPQVNAAMIVFKKNEMNMDFCSEWLRYASDERILTDLPNTCGQDNYPGFLMHRHDQSVLSLLAKRYDSIFFADPSQWGKVSGYSVEVKRRSSYPCIFNHHRIANAGSVAQVLLMQTAIAQKIIYKRYLRKEREKMRHEKMSDM